MVVLGIPKESESLDRETTDEGKLGKVWNQLDEPLNIVSSSRLGRSVPGTLGARETQVSNPGYPGVEAITG